MVTMEDDNRKVQVEDAGKAPEKEEFSKAMEEWNEIELGQLQEVSPRASETSSGASSARDAKGVEARKANGVDTEEIVADDLWRRVFTKNYDHAKSEASKQLIENARQDEGAYITRPFSGLRYLRLFVCGPPDGVEVLKSHKLRLQRLFLVALANTEFTSATIEHWHLLCDFYRKAYAAVNNTTLPATCDRTGTHWQTVGFQGMDPATDLRGVGILGLLQLHLLVTQWGLEKQQLASILQLSNDHQQHFPFAAVGLNFTSKIVTKLKNGELNGLANDTDSFVHATNQIYLGMWKLFYRDWKSSGKEIRAFNWAMQKIELVLNKDPYALYCQTWIDTPPETPRPPLPPRADNNNEEGEEDSYVSTQRSSPDVSARVGGQ